MNKGSYVVQAATEFPKSPLKQLTLVSVVTYRDPLKGLKVFEQIHEEASWWVQCC